MLIENLTHLPNKTLMSLSAYGIQGKRNHMEDFYDIGFQMKPQDQVKPNEWPYEYFYFGIFDGHGGSEAASFAKQNLLRFITKQKEFWSNDDEDIMRAIRNGFADTHSAMRENMPHWSRTGKTLPSTAGTTASILFIKNGKYYTGHVGDSRIVIAKENNETSHWIADQLTEDHKPESERETKRIEMAGGQVKDKTGVYRVVWRRPVLKEYETGYIEPAAPEYAKLVNDVPSYPVDESLVTYYQSIPFLAIARSLGDFWSINPLNGQYIVSPEPDVSCTPIMPNDKGIVLATDGLWNVMDAMKAIRFLQELDITKNGLEKYYEDEHFITDNYYDVAGKEDNHAESLVYFAYQIWERKRLRSDNITVVVAMLHDILPHFHKPSYATRSSISSYKKLSDLSSKNLKAEPIQVKQSSCFMEKIMLNTEPILNPSVPSNEIELKQEKLELYLFLPPTILGNESDLKHPKLFHPKNYARLSRAACRVINRSDSGDSDNNEIIRVKNVTDDPADLRPNPVFINSSGKQVRDSSAQVSDGIHDFGQPWTELEGEEIFDVASTDSSNTTDDYDLDDRKKVAISEGVSEDITMYEDELENSEESIDKSDEMISVAKESNKVESTISQLRCLLNYTPALRRSSRRIYVSVSENTKRKYQTASINTSMSKNKRRKSQPIRCNVYRT